MIEVSYKRALKDSIQKLQAKPILTPAEQEALQDLYDKLDCHQTYLNESGMAYEG